MSAESHQQDRDEALFPKLTAEQLAALEGFGQEQMLAPDERLFREGDDEHDFYIILDGRVKITRDVDGDEVVLVVHEPGEFTGALSLLSGEKSIANGIAVGAARVRRICTDDFRRMLAERPEISALILATMARRRPEADSYVLEREKLAALGKMAAGLAHELNNPASAAQRAAADLKNVLAALQARSVDLAKALPADAWSALDSLVVAAQSRRAAEPRRSALEQSDCEEAVGEYLEARGVADPWKLAPALVEAGFTSEQMTTVETAAGDTAFVPAITWIAARVDADTLLRSIEQSVGRIVDLVGAIKSYSYMDQAPSQQVDIIEGLENTLKILGHKWRKRNIEVVRRYSPDLPQIAAYGGELNQVWTNLLDNAIDAVPESGGRIVVEASSEGSGHVLVAITDNGSGIAPENLGRVYEPFFTTKAPGQGTGLGLDTAYRIVTRRHGGDLRVVSRPGETRFEVRLPTMQTG